MANQEMEMPLQTGTSGPEVAGVRKVHGVAEVKLVLIDVTRQNGLRETLMCSIAGDQMVIIDNKGRDAPDWLKQEVFAKMGKKAGGVEQL